MALTSVGAAAAGDIIAGIGTVALFNAANARIGVGDSSAAFAAAFFIQAVLLLAWYAFVRWNESTEKCTLI